VPGEDPGGCHPNQPAHGGGCEATHEPPQGSIAALRESHGGAAASGWPSDVCLGRIRSEAIPANLPMATSCKVTHEPSQGSIAALRESHGGVAASCWPSDVCLGRSRSDAIATNLPMAVGAKSRMNHHKGASRRCARAMAVPLRVVGRVMCAWGGTGRLPSQPTCPWPWVRSHA
jgi:hypothetical protein